MNPVPMSAAAGQGRRSLAGRFVVDRRLLRAPSSPPSTARRCSSTTRRTCAPAAARPSPRSVAISARLRHQGVPLQRRWRASPTTKGCCSTWPAAASCSSPCTPACRPTRSRCTATTRASPSCGWRSPRACATSWSTASTSSTASTRCTPRACRCRRVLARITPGVHAHTHEFIATGQDDSKFGFNLGNGDAHRAVERMRRSASVRLGGRALPHRQQRVRGVELRQGRRGDGRRSPIPLDLPELVLGGGLGVAYVEGEEAPTITQWGNVLLDACAGARRAQPRSASSRAAASSPRPRSPCTRSAPSSRSPACARTSASTAG